MHLPPGLLHFLRCKKTSSLKGAPCNRSESRPILRWILSSVSLHGIAGISRIYHEPTDGDGAGFGAVFVGRNAKVAEFSLDYAGCDRSYLSMTS
jgi:hypothetical protein